MCDYVFTTKTPDQGIMRISETYCQRASQFWVQSLMSQHNALACTHHLARTVREIEKEARKYDVLSHEYAPDEHYERRNHKGEKVNRPPAGSNYARVTVKPWKAS